MAEEIITHAEALSLIDEHIDEAVYLGILVAGQDGQRGGPAPVRQVMGRLENPLEPKPPRLRPDYAVYRIGGINLGLGFAEIAGAVIQRDNGVDFRAGDTVLIRVAWRGSSEVDNWSRTAESLTQLNGLASSEVTRKVRPNAQTPGCG